MKNKFLKRLMVMVILLLACFAVTAITISLDSPASFPVDI
ncbi:hypothetical protein MNBD_GAMMA26-1724 [hydrothermal vent metagenome]|uniref:Uncharacterized protein n=1 Tax=hydrothermal vent metagenome TaxID=652676 RepID=A0A3B1B1V8_9ZZZZ